MDDLSLPPDADAQARFWFHECARAQKRAEAFKTAQARHEEESALMLHLVGYQRFYEPWPN